MRKYQKFEEVPAWQEAARLYDKVLNLIEEPSVPLSATFRTQLERATLCVSGNVAEGFDHVSPSELISLLSSARGAAVDVQSMMSVVVERPKLARLRDSLQQIRATAEECARQLGAWKYAVENPGQKRAAPQEEATPPAAAARVGPNPAVSRRA